MQGREQIWLLVRSTQDEQLTHLGTPGLARSALTLPRSEHQGCLRR